MAHNIGMHAVSKSLAVFGPGDAWRCVFNKYNSEMQMDLTERENDILEALLGTTKSAASLIPVLGLIIAGYDAYKRSSYDRNVRNLIQTLSQKVDDIGKFFKDDFFKTKEGEKFARKVIDAALDTQLEDKQELFVNALVNAPNSESITELEKLKFVDMLRHLSRASLMILAEIHSMLLHQVRGPGRNPDPTDSYPLVAPDNIAEKLSDKYDPYLVTSSISEMESQGLFSRIGEWRKDPTTGHHTPMGGFATEMSYTDFSARFVEFIKERQTSQIES
jgi:hypothetical protein